MPTPIYDKPDYSNGIWAYSGTREVPSDEKVAIGHVVERPPYEISNYLENRQDQGIAFLLQNGIATWDDKTTYPVSALTKRDGVVYRAISQNDNTDPSSNAVVWEVAFFSNKSGQTIISQINSILTSEGYLSLYVSKANPVVDGRVRGHGYTADSGIAITGSENVGYSFNNSLLDGLYHDGAVPVILNDGSVVARFQTPQSLTENTKNVVTMDILRQVIGNQQGYGVGDIYITTTVGDPATRLGYGTWEKFAQGLTLVGQSDSGSSPNWTRTVMNQYGEYTHTITEAELPRHRFEFDIADQDTSGGTIADGSRNPSGGKAYTNYVGQDQPMNIVQPVIVVYMWRRTA